MESRVALTLRTLAGLTTAEIARAFLVPEATMAKRLVRAKQKIAHAGIPYRVPPASALPQRTAGVLTVLYLLFNEGYSASAGAELVRKSLCDDAVMLAGVLAELMPEEPEVKGLLALMMFHRSRQMAHVDDQGDLVTLEAQDRALWDQAAIEQAGQILDSALAKGKPGPYQLQAAIAACHARAPQAEMTDWPAIAKFYDQLLEMTGSPVVELNRAVAVAMADGPAVGLALVNQLEASGALPQYYLLAATRADLLRRLGRRTDAAAAYRTRSPLSPPRPNSASSWPAWRKLPPEHWRTGLCTSLSRLPRDEGCGQHDVASTGPSTHKGVEDVDRLDRRFLKRVAHSCQRWLRHGGCRGVSKPATATSCGTPAGLAQRRDYAERHEVRGGENGVDIGVLFEVRPAAQAAQMDQSPSAERLARKASPVALR